MKSNPHKRTRKIGANQDLYRIFSHLQSEREDLEGNLVKKLNTEELGLIYTLALLKEMPQRVLVSKYGRAGTDNRGILKNFQEELRISLYSIAHQLNPDINSASPDEKLSQYFDDVATLQISPDDFTPGTIEYVVSKLLNQDHGLKKIGSAVLEGAAAYWDEKPKEMKHQKYKVFLEQNRIYTALESKLE
jgi:hypothetical protein